MLFPLRSNLEHVCDVLRGLFMVCFEHENDYLQVDSLSEWKPV